MSSECQQSIDSPEPFRIVLSYKDIQKNKMLQFWTGVSVNLKADVLEISKLNDISKSYILHKVSLKQASVTLKYEDGNKELKSVTLGSSSGEDLFTFKAESSDELVQWSKKLRYNIRAQDKLRLTEIKHPQPEANYHGTVMDIGWCHTRDLSKLDSTPNWQKKFLVLTDSMLLILPCAPMKDEDLLSPDYSYSLIETRINHIESHQDVLKSKTHILALRCNNNFLIIAFETNTELLHWSNSLKKITFHVAKKSKQYSFLAGDRAIGSFFFLGLATGLMQRDSRMHLLWSYGIYHLRNISVRPLDFAVPKTVQEALGKSVVIKQTASLISKNDKLEPGSILLDFGQRNPKVEGKSSPIKVALGFSSVVAVVHILLNLVDTAALKPELVPKPVKKALADSSRERSYSNPEHNTDFSSLGEISPFSEFSFDLASEDGEDDDNKQKGRNRSQSDESKQYTWDKNIKKQIGYIPRSSSNLKNFVLPDSPKNQQLQDRTLTTTKTQ